MVQVQFRDEVNGVSITKRMAPPKKIAELSAWFKACRVAIPEIPDPTSHVGGSWTLRNTAASLRWVTWEMCNAEGARVYVIIDRTAPSL